MTQSASPTAVALSVALPWTPRQRPGDGSMEPSATPVARWQLGRWSLVGTLWMLGVGEGWLMDVAWLGLVDGCWLRVMLFFGWLKIEGWGWLMILLVVGWSGLVAVD